MTRAQPLCKTAAMGYSGRVEYADARKVRTRNKIYYRFAHWPIWIWVFFLAPGPLTFSLFAHGFSVANSIWLALVLCGTGIAGIFGQMPGVEPAPYILRFDEDKPNPLYRKVCYTFAWNAILNFALLNLAGLVIATVTGVWTMKQLYQYVYLPLCAVILVLGAAGLLPRVGRSTKGEGTERRYFYGSVWAVTTAQTLLLVLWKTMPDALVHSRAGSAIELVVYAGALSAMGLAAVRGALPRTRPIVPGDIMID
ncbi:MAG TPA: hypothetical protein VG225_03290 [Terracidiphilus sp.]|nr:hypothetical protein [Terracidiphilus sp.]